jgi:hypothetical protein
MDSIDVYSYYLMPWFPAITEWSLQNTKLVPGVTHENEYPKGSVILREPARATEESVRLSERFFAALRMTGELSSL